MQIQSKIIGEDVVFIFYYTFLWVAQQIHFTRVFPFVPSKIQLSAKEFEDEKTDRQSMQHQLQKMLKELRKARDQITRLESAVSVHEH